MSDRPTSRVVTRDVLLVARTHDVALPRERGNSDGSSDSPPTEHRHIDPDAGSGAPRAQPVGGRCGTACGHRDAEARRRERSQNCVHDDHSLSASGRGLRPRAGDGRLWAASRAVQRIYLGHSQSRSIGPLRTLVLSGMRHRATVTPRCRRRSPVPRPRPRARRPRPAPARHRRTAPASAGPPRGSARERPPCPAGPRRSPSGWHR